jgi:hypothetical protein
MMVFGGLILAGRFFLQPWQRPRTWYGVTDRRAIVVTDWFTPEVHARDLRLLDMVDIRRHRDGTGTIAFDCHIFRRATKSSKCRSKMRVCFLSVPFGSTSFTVTGQFSSGKSTGTGVETSTTQSGLPRSSTGALRLGTISIPRCVRQMSFGPGREGNS